MWQATNPKININLKIVSRKATPWLCAPLAKVTRIQAFFLSKIKMAKDPAFLFYPGDWLGGTTRFSRHQKGCYIDLLMSQFNDGPLSLEDVKTVLGIDFESHWQSKLKAKFQVDDEGRFFNKKLADEVYRRKNWTESRRLNRNSHMKQHMSPHMETGNETETKALIKAEKAVVFNFEEIWDKYPNKDGKKAAEKYFHASVRTQEDFDSINQALANYIKSERVLKGFIKNGSTWFNNWKDWITYIPPKINEGKPPAEVVAVTCVAMMMTDQQIKKHMLEKGYSEHIIDESIMRARGKVL